MLAHSTKKFHGRKDRSRSKRVANRLAAIKLGASVWKDRLNTAMRALRRGDPSKIRRLTKMHIDADRAALQTLARQSAKKRRT